MFIHLLNNKSLKIDKKHMQNIFKKQYKNMRIIMAVNFTFCVHFTVDSKLLSVPTWKIRGTIAVKWNLIHVMIAITVLLLPPKTTEWIAPSLAVARIAIIVSGISGMYIITLSPLRTPRSANAPASTDVFSKSSLYVTLRIKDVWGLSWMRAVFSPYPARTCRSTAL